MSITDNIASVRERIARAADRARRDPASVTLLAVAKGHGIDAVKVAAGAGITDFGENYLQELALKAPAIPGRWHYQGAVQRRKIRDIVKFSDSILSVSRVEELAEIEKRAEKPVECHIEVNLGGEASKGGAKPEELPVLLEAAKGFARSRIVGLMAIPPHDEDPEASRPWFRRLAALAREHGLAGLSMGMSTDFEIAIEEGATMVRVGTAIFGPR